MTEPTTSTNAGMTTDTVSMEIDEAPHGKLIELSLIMMERHPELGNGKPTRRLHVATGGAIAVSEALGEIAEDEVLDESVRMLAGRLRDEIDGSIEMQTQPPTRVRITAGRGHTNQR